jgi:hypothetical protein
MLPPPPGLRHVSLGPAGESISVIPPGAGRSTRMAYSRLTGRHWRGSLEGMQVYTHYCRHTPAHLDPGRE